MSTTAAASSSTEGRGLPFQVRGSLQTILSLRLLRPDDPDFHRLLLEKIAHAPDFFRNAPVVLDVGAIAGRSPDILESLVDRLWQHRLAAVGIQNGSAAWNEEATRLGMALFGAGAQAEPTRRAADRDGPAAKAAASMVIKQPVRGGQQIVNHEGDLVVMAPVSAGAELAATGHIHIYAPLRGRAFAGMEGDENAMIFCDQLEAELVSVAGFHMVNEEIDKRVLGKRAKAFISTKRLVVEPLP